MSVFTKRRKAYKLKLNNGKPVIYPKVTNYPAYEHKRTKDEITHINRISVYKSLVIGEGYRVGHHAGSKSNRQLLAVVHGDNK